MLTPVCNIPVDSPRVPDGTGRPSPAWLRPVRKRASASPAPDRPSPSNIIDFTGGSGDIMSNPAAISQVGQNLNTAPPATDLEALFNTSDYFDLSAMSPGPNTSNEGALAQFVGLGEGVDTLENFTAMATGQNMGGHAGQGMNGINGMNGFGGGGASGSSGAAAGGNETIMEMMGFTDLGAMRAGGAGGAGGNEGNGASGGTFNPNHHAGMSTLMGNAAAGGQDGQNHGEVKFDFGFNGAGFGGEQLAGEGMDSVSDGLKGNDAGQGL